MSRLCVGLAPVGVVAFAMALGMAGGCSSSDDSAPALPDAASDTVVVEIVLAGDRSVILGSAWADASWAPTTTPPPDDDDTIAWELRDGDGALRGSGTLVSARRRTSETRDAAGQPTGVLLRSELAIVDIVAPNNEGDLAFFEGAAPGATATKSVHIASSTPAGTPIWRTHVKKTVEPFASPFLPDAMKTATPPKLIAGTCGARVNLVFLPEGFTQAELGTYHDEVASMATGLFRIPGWDAHTSDVAIWEMDVASKDSGVTDPGCTGAGCPDPSQPKPAVKKDTAFGLSFGVDGPGTARRCVSVAEAQFEPVKLAVKFWAKWKTAADYLVVYVNETERAGCQNDGWITMSRISGEARELVLAHELGHGLFVLGDEYVDANICATPHYVEKWAAALNWATSLAALPWSDLVNTSELPTKRVDPSIVGAYEGTICPTGIYRPQANCMMRDETFGRYCAVCRRELDRYFDKKAAKKAGAGNACAAPPGDAGVEAAANAGDASPPGTKNGTIGLANAPGNHQVSAIFTDGLIQDGCTHASSGPCTINDCSGAIVTPTNLKSAGSIVITGGLLPPGGVTLSDDGQGHYGLVQAVGAAFNGGEPFVATGSGGDLPPFVVHGVAPSRIALVSPIPPASGALTIDRASPFVVTWTGGTGSVAVSLYGSKPGIGKGEVSMNCMFDAAAGSGTIPASVLGLVPATGAATESGHLDINVITMSTTPAGTWSVALGLVEPAVVGGQPANAPIYWK